MIVTIAVHAVFIFILGLTMNAKKVDHITQKQEVTQNVTQK